MGSQSSEKKRCPNRGGGRKKAGSWGKKRNQGPPAASGKIRKKEQKGRTHGNQKGFVGLGHPKGRWVAGGKKKKKERKRPGGQEALGGGKVGEAGRSGRGKCTFASNRPGKGVKPGNDRVLVDGGEKRSTPKKKGQNKLIAGEQP